MSQETTGSRSGFAAIVVRLAGLWVLAGAVAKLLLGTPKDLPEIVRAMTPFGLDLTFHLVIGVELAIVCLAWLKPRLAWPVILALFAFFDFILVKQLAAGAESCGCFGATIKVSPWLMLGVDSVLLIALLASRPWKLVGTGLPSAVLAVGVLVSFALPWLWIDLPAATTTTTAGGTAGTATTPAPGPRYVVWEPETWVNKSIYEVEDLTRWVKPEEMPTDGKVVIWRQGCEHCAAHLRAMAGKDDGAIPVLLVQIRDDLKDGRAVDLMPQGPHVTTAMLPENQEVVLQTPWELKIEGGMITAALDEEHAKALYE